MSDLVEALKEFNQELIRASTQGNEKAFKEIRRIQEENEKLRKALKNLVEAAESLAFCTNVSAIDRYIEEAKKALKIDQETKEKTNSVADIPDDILVKRAVASARDKYKRKGELHPRWVAVMDVFSLGSTYARQLCLRFKINPDEEVKK